MIKYKIARITLFGNNQKISELISNAGKLIYPRNKRLGTAHVPLYQHAYSKVDTLEYVLSKIVCK